MKTFNNYVKEKFNIEVPKGDISGDWFIENSLPMIVACTCCGSTMCSIGALVDDDGQVYCSSCGEVDSF